MKNTIQLYRDFVRFLSTTADKRIFFNTDTDHAVVVLVQIFEQSKDIVRIFAGNLCRMVGNSPEYIAALSDFVERGGKLRILLNDYNEELAKNSNLYKRLAYFKSIGKDVIVKKTDAKPYRKSDVEKKELHFTIGDNKAYRIETDIKNRTAECSMNNTETATATAEFYDGLFNRENTLEIDILGLFGYDE